MKLNGRRAGKGAKKVGEGGDELLKKYQQT